MLNIPTSARVLEDLYHHSIDVAGDLFSDCAEMHQAGEHTKVLQAHEDAFEIAQGRLDVMYAALSKAQPEFYPSV